LHGIAEVLASGAITLLAGHISQVLEPTCVLSVPLPQALQALAAPEKPTSQIAGALVAAGCGDAVRGAREACADARRRQRGREYCRCFEGSWSLECCLVSHEDLSTFTHTFAAQYVLQKVEDLKGLGFRVEGLGLKK
jgi:hypothetical protein